VSKVLYVVRHCQAEGQEPSASLTQRGKQQAEALCAFLADLDVERIVSSPFARAVESIRPLSVRLGIPVETDQRLVERTLSTMPLADWREQLRMSFQDLDLVIGGGESSQAAMQRASAVLVDILGHPAKRTVVVTHGNLMALMLKTFDDSIGFDLWERLTYPDVCVVKAKGAKSVIQKIWA
jgi:2,3-bisphosphoglycerate-dependent phosphoglycerate mutase